MSRAAQTFRRNDVVRAIRAARAAGEDVSRVEIDKHGKISVILGKSAAPPPSTDSALEKWLVNED